MIAYNIHTKITTLNDFIKSCNELYKKWVAGNVAVLNKDYGYTKKFQDGLPEPYLGNPNDCSAVIININPGGVECGFNDRSSILRRTPTLTSYQDFVIDFPYKLTKTDRRKGLCTTTDWWIHRTRWIESIFKSYKRETCDKRPFALEFCPWHSINWNGWSSLKVYVENWIIEPLRIAIEHSQLPFALAVVSPKVYQELIDYSGCGFKVIKIWKILGSTISCPSERIVKQQGRFYALLEKDGVYILCTFYYGGNQAPSKDFENSEIAICDLVKSILSEESFKTTLPVFDVQFAEGLQNEGHVRNAEHITKEEVESNNTALETLKNKL